MASELGGPGGQRRPPRPGGRPFGGRCIWRGIGERHGLGTQQRHADLRAGFAGARFGRANQRFELPFRQLCAVEFVVELAVDGPQILLILIGIEQAGEPIQSDDAVHSRGVVDPPEGIGGRR